MVKIEDVLKIVHSYFTDLIGNLPEVFDKDTGYYVCGSREMTADDILKWNKEICTQIKNLGKADGNDN